MKKVLLHPNPKRDIGFECTKKTALLLREYGVKVFVSNCDYSFEDKEIILCPFNDAIKDSDMIIALGGDGSILHTAKHAAYHNIPILGINIGRVGYMAELESNELDLLGKIIEGDYTVEERLMLEVDILRDNKSVYRNLGLNDLVISKTGITNMIDLDIYMDGNFISHYSGDRVVSRHHRLYRVFHVRGRTIVDPLSESITITPVCTHSCRQSPLCFHQSELSISTRLPIKGAQSARALTARKTSGFVIKTSYYPGVPVMTRLIKVKNLNFYDILCEKLTDRRFDDR